MSEPIDPDVPDVTPGRRPPHLQAGALVLVFVGGAVGTAARFGLAVLEPTHPGRWPLGTFLANVLGALVLGALLEALARSGPDDGWRRRARLLVGTGFCGGLTTYSTFAVEIDLLVSAHRPALAVGYLAGSVAAGLAAVVAGVALASAVHRGRAT